jgi:uncharacterized membrane-anchored protein
MAKKIALLSLLFILIAINLSIYQKEQHRKKGENLYLELAPVDPRSLMQGDYMALRFKVTNAIYDALKQQSNNPQSHRLKASQGEAIIRLDKHRIGTFKALYTNQKLLKDEILLYYRVRNAHIKLATNAFFFQEGSGKIYERAKYGHFRIKNSHPLLVDMFDENLTRLGGKGSNKIRVEP